MSDLCLKFFLVIFCCFNYERTLGNHKKRYICILWNRRCIKILNVIEWEAWPHCVFYNIDILECDRFFSENFNCTTDVELWTTMSLLTIKCVSSYLFYNILIFLQQLLFHGKKLSLATFEVLIKNDFFYYIVYASQAMIL